ncbi:MAG: TlpA family protein disulfide reductase [Bacteriovoracaceae bacterium]
MQPLSDFKGQPTFYSFFQPGCESCHKQALSFQCLEQKFPQKLKVIYIGTFADSKMLLREVNKSKLVYQALESDENFLKAIGGVKYTPYTLVTNAQGDLVTKIPGSYSCQQFVSLVNEKKLLNN